MAPDKEFFREIMGTFKKRKRNMILTGIGVFGSIFLLVFLMSAGNGLENGVHNRFKSIKTNSLFFSPNFAKLQYKNFPSNRQVRFNYYDFQNLKVFLGKKAGVMSCRYSSNEIKTLYNQSVSTTCNYAAVDYENNQTRPLNVLQGSYISEKNFLNKEKVIMIGKTLKEDLFGTNNALGSYIMMDKNYYKIIGIFESLKEGQSSNFDNNLALIPLTVYHTDNNNLNISSIEIICNDEKTYNQVKYEADSYLRRIKYIDPNDTNAIILSDTKREFSKYISLFRNIRYFLWFVSLSMLFMGLMNVSNVIMITVNERMREIGIRKSLGATPLSIYYMIITESVLLTLVSGLAGLIAGTGLIKFISYLMNRFNWNNEFFMHPYVNYTLIFYALMILLIAGTLAGLAPARRAVKIKPIEVLRHE